MIQLSRLFHLSLLFLLFNSCTQQKDSLPGQSGNDWPEYLGNAARSHYSTLEQINLQNVNQLQVAWTYQSGGRDTTNNQTQIQCNPIIIDGILYATSPRIEVFALNAATGKEIWKFSAADFWGGKNASAGTNRGVTYWKSDSDDDQRILFTAGSFLFSLDARTGKPIASFGDSGRVDMRKELDYDKKDFFIVSNTPGVTYKDFLIMGMRLSETADAAPGHVRAYNIRTGKREWIFHTIPQPGEYGYDTWEDKDSWKKIGGANCWTGMAVDSQRGIVFVPTGSAAFDFYGGNRKGQNLFANCLIALDARTGKRIWHFQTVHHDIWDRDLPSPPNLITVTQNGKKIDAVAQTTKSGFVFLFERETGRPLFPIEEKPVQESTMPGEKAWPTQPRPVKPQPFARQSFEVADVNSFSTQKDSLIAKLKTVKTGENFIPPSREGTVILPGFDGGAEWGGAAADPDGILYINSNEMPWILQMIDIPTVNASDPHSEAKQLFATNCTSCHGANRQGNGVYPSLIDVKKRRTETYALNLLKTGKGFMPAFAALKDSEREALVNFLFDKVPQQKEPGSLADMRTLGVPYTITGYNRFVDKDGYPAIKPPWGTLNAIDMNTGEYLWKVPLGEYTNLTTKGIAVTGTENYGGPVVTAGGLLFIAATKDEKFRAFDKKTGKIVWETQLPAGGYATPSTYAVNGKQYVVIACGGGKMNTKSGDSYVAFALPEK
ncbi:outer membrane protein assembly factor BamB family protein [Xanthocytophaga flava]|uniref:outer membrane protein assembly factor BamB family protein n=1 Tax=Xanthocytophaga flava TaxID=3048013 RepID=UPI0028D2CEF9|nr:PQQ-binding-like beta-propeller repeat protein [Xanthocytophaga flavus]MDJ1469509.1 PQQ-binding-like beta-propeller repeat protein [Xanthocytophaga flavus]